MEGHDVDETEEMVDVPGVLTAGLVNGTTLTSHRFWPSCCRI